MATVNEGKVVLFGAGGPVGASAIAALKDHYALRVTDLRPMTAVAAAPPQSPRAPIPEVLGLPHENRVVDITDYAQVLAACEGMDAAINVSVIRPHPVLAFQVNMVGAYNVAKRRRSLRPDQILGRAHYAGLCRARGPRSALLCLYAFSPEGSAARGTGARCASVRDFLGRYRGGVLVWVAGIQDAVAVREFLPFAPGCRTTSTGPTRPSGSWDGRPRIGLRRCTSDSNVR